MVAIFIQPSKNVYTCTVLECGPIAYMRGLIPFMAQVVVHLCNGNLYLAFVEKNDRPFTYLILIGQKKSSKFSVRLFFLFICFVIYVTEPLHMSTIAT